MKGRTDSSLSRHLSREGDQGSFPQTLAHASTDPLSLLLWLAACPPRGSETEPEAGRQDAKVLGSTPHPCPSFSGHPKGRGQPPSLLGKGRRESVEGARRCWADRCYHEAHLPPTLGIRNLDASSWAPPTNTQTGSYGRPHSCPSLSNGAEYRL